MLYLVNFPDIELKFFVVVTESHSDHTLQGITDPALYWNDAEIMHFQDLSKMATTPSLF